MKPLRVAFDFTIFNYQVRGGVSKYVSRLVEELPAFNVHPKVIAPLYVNEYLPALAGKFVWGRKIAPSLRQEAIGRKLAQTLHAPLSRLAKADLIHESYYHSEETAPQGLPVVTTIHDMIFELNPGIEASEYQIRTKKDALARADAIICVSENTRRDLLFFYPQYESRTTVALLGFDQHFGRRSEDFPAHPRPYILYVGVRRDYKNFGGLVAAFASSPRLRQDFDLVLVGGGPLTSEEQDRLSRAGVAGRTHHRQANDAQLAEWYHHAAVFVYPSLYEGFGIPPLEGMAAGCPVVTMKVSSIPEVCGDAVEYAAPGDADSLRMAVEAVVYSPSRSDALRRLGQERIKLFSWAECARLTSNVYRTLLP